MGVNVVFIGNGLPAMADDFINEQKLTNTVWTDPKRESYRLLGFKRGWKTFLSLPMWAYGVKAFAAGFRQTKTKGDPVQQGGVLVVRRGGELVYAYASATAGDHPPIATVLAKAKEAAGSRQGSSAPDS